MTFIACHLFSLHQHPFNRAAEKFWMQERQSSWRIGVNTQGLKWWALVSYKNSSNSTRWLQRRSCKCVSDQKVGWSLLLTYGATEVWWGLKLFASDHVSLKLRSAIFQRMSQMWKVKNRRRRMKKSFHNNKPDQHRCIYYFIKQIVGEKRNYNLDLFLKFWLEDKEQFYANDKTMTVIQMSIQLDRRHWLRFHTGCSCFWTSWCILPFPSSCPSWKYWKY